MVGTTGCCTVLGAVSQCVIYAYVVNVTLTAGQTVVDFALYTIGVQLSVVGDDTLTPHSRVANAAFDHACPDDTARIAGTPLPALVAATEKATIASLTESSCNG